VLLVLLEYSFGEKCGKLTGCTWIVSWRSVDMFFLFTPIIFEPQHKLKAINAVHNNCLI
jgi:hypothetical protein